MGGTRGVTPVVAVILLVGITLTGAAATVVVGGATVGELSSSAELTQGERAIEGVAADLDEKRFGGSASSTFDLSGTGGEVSVEEAGSLTIEYQSDGGTDETETFDLGALVYEHEGTTVAYQSGGIWRDDGDGVYMHREPNVQYTDSERPTLTMPITTLVDERRSTAVSGELVKTEPTRTAFPTGDTPNPLEGGVVTMEFETPYCAGWETFFADRTDADVIEACEDDETLVVELRVPFQFDAPEETIVASNVTYDGDAEINGSYVDDADMTEWDSAERIIDAAAERCAEPIDEDATGDVSIAGEGPHCYASIDKADLDIDTGVDDDVVIYVAGNANPDDIDITGEGAVTLFIDGNLEVQGNDTWGNVDDPSQLRIFLADTADFENKGAGTGFIHAMIYGPSSTVDLRGDIVVTGGIFAEEVHLQGNTAAEPDESITNGTYEYGFGGSDLYFLHVDETEVEVRN